MDEFEFETGDSIDFYEAQGNIGDSYFLYISQNPETDPVSCYFGFSSAEQLLNSLVQHLDFWEWSEGSEEASEAMKKIIASDPDAVNLSDQLLSRLNEYTKHHASLYLIAWGKFDDLCVSSDPFCEVVRIEFRESVDNWDYDEDPDESEDAVDENTTDLSRPIDAAEIDEFIEYLSQTPT